MALMRQVLSAAFLLLATSWITPSVASYYPATYDPYYDKPVYYSYDWEVKDEYSGQDYRQQETRNGQLTTGLYQVLLPDGRHQTVNYRVDKDSGFMADVTYQGEANYFNFQSNYKPVMKEPKSYGYKPVAVAPAAYPSRPASPNDYHRDYPAYPPPPKVSYPPAATTTYRPVTTTPEPLVYQEEQEEVEWSTEEPQPEREVTKSYPSSSSGMLFPLYRVDYYAARAKAGKTIPETGYYAVDDSGSTYIKAAPVYSAPEKLGTYEINHRKATVRKPSKSDYQAPESLLRQDN